MRKEGVEKGFFWWEGEGEGERERAGRMDNLCSRYFMLMDVPFCLYEHA